MRVPQLARLILVLLPAALFAQWPPYPTPNVPKLPNGKPNLEAPAPRTMDGKVDLSGLWEFVDANPRTPRAESVGSATNAAKPADVAASAPAQELGAKAAGALVGLPSLKSQFFDIGSTLPGGLPYSAWGAEVRKERIANNTKDNPDAHCLPMGLMQFHTHPQPRQMVQTPNLIVIIYEANYGLREIHLDGRQLPSKDADPWWYGYSVGRWEGDTLVVETTGFRDDVWLDVEGSPLTSNAKMIERFRRPNYGHLEIEITVEDSKAYTKPWTVKINQKILLNSDLIEFICNENERSDAHLVGK